MSGSLKVLITVAFIALFALLVMVFLRSGPDPETGRCVDARKQLVDCDARTAVYELVREVDSPSDCPADSLRHYTFRSSLYCAVALRGAPEPSGEYVSCLLLAGAKLARKPADVSFAEGGASSPGGTSSGAVKVRGDGWRIFYVLFEGQLDPGLSAIVANPAKVAYVAYFARVSAQRREIAAATRCEPGAPPA